MDLGATVCTPKRPNCLLCPVRDWCAAHGEGEVERYPVKPEKKARPQRRGEVYAVFRGGDVLVERRPERGLLGGMLALPTTEWLESGMGERPGWVDDGDAIGEVRHVFTHFELRLSVMRLTLADAPSGFDWMPADEAGEAFPSVFRKALKLAR